MKSLFCIDSHVDATMEVVTSISKIEPPLEIQFL